MGAAAARIAWARERGGLLLYDPTGLKCTHVWLLDAHLMQDMLSLERPKVQESNNLHASPQLWRALCLLRECQ